MFSLWTIKIPLLLPTLPRNVGTSPRHFKSSESYLVVFYKAIKCLLLWTGISGGPLQTAIDIWLPRDEQNYWLSRRLVNCGRILDTFTLTAMSQWVTDHAELTWPNTRITNFAQSLKRHFLCISAVRQVAELEEEVTLATLALKKQVRRAEECGCIPFSVVDKHTAVLIHCMTNWGKMISFFNYFRMLIASFYEM